MATREVKVWSLDVGQGMCTFVMTLDEYNEPTRTLLFDLGSTHNKHKVGSNLALMAYWIKNRKGGPYLDAVFLSHKDADHVNLMEALLELIPGVGIGDVYYGGRYLWYSKARGNILNDLKGRGATLHGFPVGATTFVEGGFTRPLWSANDLGVYLLMANTPHKNEPAGRQESQISTRPDGDQANSKSLVCVVVFDGKGFVISGDATFPTFAYINAAMGISEFATTQMMLLPHHGSRKTTFGLDATAGAISTRAKDTVDTFARKMGAKTLIASADTKHSHPSLETERLFQNYTDREPWWWDWTILDDGLGLVHFMSSYLDYALGVDGPRPGQYMSFLTKWNVYSTLYLNPRTIGYFEYPTTDGFTKLSLPRKWDYFPEGMNFLYSVWPGRPTRLEGHSSNRTVTQETAMALLRSSAEAAPPPRHVSPMRVAPSPPLLPARSVHRPTWAPPASRQSWPLPNLKKLG